MALLRQCLQELRLRRGEMDLVWEGPHAIVGDCRIDASMGLHRHDDACADRAAARSDVTRVRAHRALAADTTWQ